MLEMRIKEKESQQEAQDSRGAEIDESTATRLC
jgi:hypothetical protein